MTTINTSPYLGYININPNKEYYVAEYLIKDDDFLGKLNIDLDRPANIYIFPTYFNEITGLYESNGSGLFKQTDSSYSFEGHVSETKDAKFIIILEYDAMVLGVNTPLKPKIVFTQSKLGEIYHSDFYMFETRSGIPYPAHDIGAYSRNEFDIQQTRSMPSYKRIGIISDITTGTGSDSTVNAANVEKHCKNFIQGMMGFNYRPIVLQNLTIVVSGSTMGAAMIANASTITNKILQNKMVLAAEEAYVNTTNETAYIRIVQQILNEADYNTTLQLIDDLMDIAYDYSAPLILSAQKLDDLANDTTLLAKITQFINAVFVSTTVTDTALTDLGVSLGILMPINAITTVVTNGGLTTTKYLNEMTISQAISGRLDLSGQSQYTGKYASSKILVGHYHENERGYLKHTVATDRYGKTHKDPFVKNKELWGKEEDYIYLDLLHGTKNIFSNSNKIMNSVALVTDKQFKTPPKGTVKFRFLDEDEYKANGNIIEVIDDYVINDVYSAVYRAQRSLAIMKDDEERFYVLTNKSDFMKLFVHNEDDVVDYIFWYSQRVGTYRYSFVDENDVPIQDDYVITNKPTSAYAAPIYVYNPPLSVDVPTYERTYYKLIGPAGIQYSAARWKDDYFAITFKYKLITSSFIFNLMDGETDILLPFDNNTILTMAGAEINAIDATPPNNANPVIYTGVTSLTYTPPTHVKLDDLHKYKTTAGSFSNLVATEINPVVENNVKYELIRSRFIYQFMDEKDNALDIPKIYPRDIRAEYIAPLVLHTETMAEDEYYILETAPSPDLYPSYINVTEYPKVELRAIETQADVMFVFKYKRLTGKIKLNFISSEDAGLIDIEGQASTMTFEKVASLKTISTGTSVLTGLSQMYVIPQELQANRNKMWKLLTTDTPANQMFIITPDDPEIEYNFIYEPIRIYPTVNFTLSSTCEQRTYTKYLLLDDSDTIIGKWDLSTPSFELNPPNGLNGLTVKLTKRVIFGGSEVALTNVMPIDITPTSIITPDNETADHAGNYDGRIDGQFVFNTTILSNRKYRLVGFTNFPDGLHSAGHKIFELTYDNPLIHNEQGYGSYVPSDFIRQGINFMSTQLNVGQKFKVVDGSTAKGKVFMEIDLSKELDEEVFKITGAVATGSFTIS